LNNNEDIHNLQIQNEQLLERMQDTCYSSHVSYCHMVDCFEDSHDMVDHEKCRNLNVINVFEDEIEEIQKIYVVEEELELSLDEGYAISKEEHDSSTLEPIYDKGFTLLKELHDTTVGLGKEHKEEAHVRNQIRCVMHAIEAKEDHEGSEGPMQEE